MIPIYGGSIAFFTNRKNDVIVIICYQKIFKFKFNFNTW